MKTKLVSLLLLMIIVFNACNTVSESNYTPQISIYPRFIVHKIDTLIGKDTIDLYLTNTSGEYLLDTITVGDTVLIPITLNALANSITAFYLLQSPADVTTISLPLKSWMDSLFLSSSNYADGKFIANGTFSYLFFPFKYIAEKPSNDAKLSITVSSNAVFEDFSGTNTKSLTLKTPIVSAK